MKHYMKPTQEKLTTQIISHIGTNNLVSKKNFIEIANVKSAKTDKSKVATGSLAPRKYKLNAKAKEVNTFLKEKRQESDFHTNINRHCHNNGRSLHINNTVIDRCRRIFWIILKRYIFRKMQWTFEYPYY